MAREEESEAWGTWEELLLGFAVKRHGLDDWDSVAAEVRSKSSLPRLWVSASRCKVKFHDLKRRFAKQNDAVLKRDEDETVPWLDELRKLRVAELKREVRNYDVSILSLETKVKRLEEERELNVRGNGISHGKPDLEELRERSENQEGDEPERTGGESDREGRSVNESNTTGSKGKSGGEEVRLGLEPLQTGSNGPASEPVAEHSDDGSSDTVAKSQSVTELRSDSAARESSEVQSSASLTRKRKRRGRRRREASGGMEPAETMEVTGKSQPFVRVLEMIRAHRSGSLFERRLEIQGSEEYQSLVKQHVDLETVQSRIVKGTYSSCTLGFYRDLLLLFNNAALFFPKSSLESITAHQLRHLLLNEIPKRSNSFPKEHSPAPNAAASPFQPKPELERSHSLLAKHNSPAPLIVCRKRSSISAKPNSSATTFSQKGKQASDEKTPALDPNSPPIKPSSDKSTLKTKAKEKPVTGVRSLRRSNKNPTNNNTTSASNKKQTSMSPSSKPGLGNKLETPKTDQKKKTEALTLGKKRSAADFLKRIKWNSPKETVKSSGSKEQKRRHNGKGGDRKDKRVLRQSSDKKVAREENSPSKRSVGRPPRTPAEANAVSVKRGKESGGKEVAALKRPRKRARR